MVIGGRYVDMSGNAASKRAAADRTMADQIAFLRHLKSIRGGDNWFQRALKNNAAAGLRILTSLPSQAVLAAKIPSAGVIGAYGQLGRVVPLPASASARSWSEGVGRDVYDSTVGTVADIKRRWEPVVRGDWDQVGRNLESGDALIMALETATLGRLGGSAAGVARRGAARGAQGAIARGVDTPLTRYLSTTKHFDKSPTAAIRQRGTRTYNLRDAEGNVIASVTRDLGRFSKNPMVRGGQRLRTNLANTLQENVLEGTQLGKTQFNARAKQQARREARGLEAGNAEMVTKITRDAQRALSRLKKERTGSGMDVRVAPFEDMAAFMHAQGWLQHPDPDMRPAQIRDQIVAKLEAGIDERVKTVGDKGVAASRRQVEVMRSIPESYLDLATAPSRMRDAVTEIQKMGIATRNLRLDMVSSKPDNPRRVALAQAFDDASYRGAGQLHGGLEFDPKKPTAPTLAAKAERDAAKAELDGLLQRKTTAPERVALDQAKRGDRTSLKLKRREIRDEINKTKAAIRTARENGDKTAVKRQQARLDDLRSRLQRIPQEMQDSGALTAEARTLINELEAAAKDGSKSARGALVSLRRALANHQRRGADAKATTPKLRAAVTRAKKAADSRDVRDAEADLRRLRGRALAMSGRNVDDPQLLARLERSLGRKQNERVGSLGDIVAAARRLRDAQDRYSRVSRQKSGRGDWTDRGPMWEGQQPGTYIKAVPIDPLANPKKIRIRDIKAKGGLPDSRSSIMQGLGPMATHRSRGELLRLGNLMADPKLSILSAKEAVAAAFRAKFADQFTTNNAIVGNNGKVLTGEDAFRLAVQNPDDVVLVAKDKLVKSLDQAAELADGQTMSKLETEGMFFERIPENSHIREEVLANPQGYIAVPKAFHDTMLGMIRDPRTTAGRKFDNAMNTWKSGMLVYAPRWWVNNFLGNSFLYGMLAGVDIRSIRQAVRSLRRDDLADILPPDVKAHGLVNEVLEGRRAFDDPTDNRVRTRVGRFTESMFHLQNSFEQIWRRAAYINQIKKQARDAGVLDRKLRIKDADEALIAAVDDLPAYVKGDALDKALRFLGDYQNMTQFERTWMRRVFPFYSWLRVISRLTFTLPFKDPGRLLAMAYLGQIATENEQPLDDLRAYYEQGALNLPGNLIMRTSSSNPLQTLVEPISKLASGDVTGASREFLGQTNPLIQLLTGKTTGVDAFTGREYTAPAVWNNSFDQFGMGRKELDEQGRVVESRPSPSWFDMLVRATPIANQVRPLLSDRYGYSPYGTTSTLDLIRFALGDKTPEEKARLFLPPSETARPITRSPWTVALGYTGFPVLSRDEEAEVDRELKNLEERYPDAQEAARKRMEGNVRKFLEDRIR